MTHLSLLVGVTDDLSNFIRDFEKFVCFFHHKATLPMLPRSSMAVVIPRALKMRL